MMVDLGFPREEGSLINLSINDSNMLREMSISILEMTPPDAKKACTNVQAF
jgi:hypothetical protein